MENFMKIAVCMKQVPAYSEGNMDEKTGVLLRQGLVAISNVYDLPALETALQIKEQTGASVAVFTMGPETAEKVIRDAYACGADSGYLISDITFAGADVLATSYTLMQAIKSTGDYDLILCGKQTTDGDTAQVSGALAKWLEIPHINWVSRLVEVSEKYIGAEYLMGAEAVTARITYPCLLAVEPSVFTPRMPSLKLKMQAGKKSVNRIGLIDLEDKDSGHYGLAGSATKVKKIFPPKRTQKQPVIRMDGKDSAAYIKKIVDDIM